jgi:hypothetical protein
MSQKIAITLFVIFILAGCSKEGHIEFDAQNSRLEELPAGKWLTTFDISYSPGADEPKKQILFKLRQEGQLHDEYKREENGNLVTTRVWNYKGHTIKEQYYQGGIWKGPIIIPYQEYYQGELSVWISIEYPKGIPYSKLLPNHHKKINPSRKYEHTAPLTSKKDHARLFLFGYGSLCQRISLF